MSLQTRNIGRLPIYYGDYDQGKSYKEKNRVTLYGSEFQASKDNPSKAPLTYNSSTHQITEWNVVNGEHASPNGEWYIISNGTDAWIASHKMGEIIASLTSISLSVSPSVIYAKESGQTVFVTSTITTTGIIRGHNIIKIHKGIATKISDGTSEYLSGYDSSTNTTSNITYRSSVLLDSGIVVKKDLTLYVKYPIYFGAAATWDAINNDSHKASARTSPIGTYSITVSQNGQSVFFNVPSEMSIAKATLNGFDMPFKPYVSKTIDGVAYKSYESANTYNEGTLDVVIVSYS